MTLPLDPLPLFGPVPVIPVVVIEDHAFAAPLARMLVEAGLPVIEITLRTESSLESIREIARHVPNAIVGAGTVLSPAQLDEAIDAGARYVVSPGASGRLLSAFATAKVPCMPGVATASEAMTAAEAGFRALKLFPAEASGGVAMLKALFGPLPHLSFCPTGGIDVQRAATYLGLKNVLAVGGTWVTPPDLLAAHDLDRMSALARGAAALATARPKSS
jgi:2-dehydro-3-deoxyphosphogluconate aldolase/(4S)-4-hydroxy-2-oxoglutarate aldolase